MSCLQAIDRRERLRRLALETIDLSKDPYFMRNHLGQYECRLCLTLHTNEGNYLAHTQVSSVAECWLPRACSVGTVPLAMSRTIEADYIPVVRAQEARGPGQWAGWGPGWGVGGGAYPGVRATAPRISRASRPGPSAPTQGYGACTCGQAEGGLQGTGSGERRT